jgi:hypothetical protein
MKAITTLLAVMLLSKSIFANDSTKNVVIDHDTTMAVLYNSNHWILGTALVLSDGRIIAPGMSLKLGKGTLINGDFNYIATPSNTMEAKLKRSTTLKSLKIEKIKKKGNAKVGFTYTIICEYDYHVQLEDAFASGELVN